MSELQTKIQTDLKAAMKARSELELSTLRLLKSDIQYEMTKTGVDTLPDDQIEALIKRAVKKRVQSIEEFQKAGRTEQADQEEAEKKILERYLPEEVDAEAIEAEIEIIFADMKPAGPSDMGKVMGRVMGKFKGQNIDGKLVKELVQKRLQAG